MTDSFTLHKAASPITRVDTSPTTRVDTSSSTTGVDTSLTTGGIAYQNFVSMYYTPYENKIMMPSEPSHEIDTKKINQYRELMGEKFFIPFNYILRKIKYVSFDTFYQQLIISVDKFIESNIQKIDIVIPYDENEESVKSGMKSNLWMTLLFIKVLKSKSKDHIIEFVHITKNIPNDDKVYVRVDDCAYTGLQLNATLVNDKITYLILPYLSMGAYNLLAKKKNIIICSNNIIDNIFTENYFKIDNKIILKNDLFYYEISKNKNKKSKNVDNEPKSVIIDLFKISDQHTTVYFQHKVADDLSVPFYFLNNLMIVKSSAIIIKNFEYTELNKPEYNSTYTSYAKGHISFLDYDINVDKWEPKDALEYQDIDTDISCIKLLSNCSNINTNYCDKECFTTFYKSISMISNDNKIKYLQLKNNIAQTM